MERNHSTEILSYQSLVETMSDAAVIFVCNENMQIIYSNHLMWNLFDCKTEEEFLEFCNGSYANLFAESDKAGMISVIREAQRLQHTSSHISTYRITTKVGIEKTVTDSGMVLNVFDDGGAVFNILRENTNQALFQTHEKLKGVYKKEQFYHYADRILRQAEAQNQEDQYSFAYCNIRNFKFYNMKFGRHAGDLLLQDLIDRIREHKSALVIGHFSSDHFVIFSNDTNITETIQMVCAAFDKDYDGTGLKLKIGFYPVSRKGTDVEFACDLAKIACDAINDSPASVQEYTDQLEQQLKLENYVDTHFEAALRDEAIQVYYQPVIRTISGAICGAEALARWIDPEIGMMSPTQFIPVLEKKRLITKLDLYMLRQVCRDLHSFIQRRGLLLPVSFNLSKLDFVECDIFHEIEAIVMEYNVPRDLINIEITESIVMMDPIRLKEIITSFRSAGYQVWMDDFGSQMSSLNVLDNYSFDEIKLDMLFLRSFGDRSKEIIRSVIQMAKRLGIQTLAEGVETREQFEYLREIGCEKVQGFYFSKPVPLPLFLQYQKENMIPIELRGMRTYYDRIGKIDHITDRTLALVEFHKGQFHFLYVNQEYERVSKELGNGEFIFSEYILNSQASTLSRKFRELQAETAYGRGFRQMDYSINGKYFRLRSKCISSCDGYDANLIEIENMTWGEIDEKAQTMDYLFRIMYSMYDDIFLLDDQSAFQNVLTNEFDVSSPEHSLSGTTLTREEIAERFVQWADRKEFMEFTDPTHLKNRLKQEPRGYETRYFRTRIRNGAYIWKANTIQYIPDTDMLIYSTRPAFLDQKGLMEKVAPDALIHNQNQMDQLLWNNIYHSKTINLFWKDANRRFVGVNQKFLETYGYDSANVLIGKTDEDMNWHVNDEPFRNDELRVLKNGESFTNHIGKCIIKGVLHTILATKEPIYRDGKIVGLIGYFIDLDELSSKYGDPESIHAIDIATGLLSPRGLSYVLAEYIEAWTGRKEKFAAVHINFREYKRAFDSYGSNIVNRMISELGDMLKELAGNDSSIARIYAGTFILIKKYTEKDTIRQIISNIEQKMRSVHTLAGLAATLNPTIQAAYAEDDASLQEVIALATGSTSVTEDSHLFTDHALPFDQKQRHPLVGQVKTDIAEKPTASYTVDQLMQKYESAINGSM